jgi:NSS family neurotransmitter:Na+ symporter
MTDTNIDANINIEHRESWGSRAGFILAAVGSAVGLGNVWRFPYECYSHGGSAFLIPYIIAMIVIGVPMLIMELSLGNLTQRAAPEAFKQVGRKWEFVGWWPIILSFMIVCYYAAVLGWCVNYLFYSFIDPLPWKGQAATFFSDDYLQRNYSMEFGQLRWPIVWAMLGIWVLMYFCIFRGVKVVSKIVLWTVPIPCVMLLILLIRGLTLEGAVAGLEYFLEPDWTELKDVKVWRAAFGQVFFTLSLAFGIMITYASFLNRKSDINNNAVIIALSDLATCIVASIAVFATMGSLALQTNQPVGEVLEGSKAMGLAFVAFPEALAALPGAQIFSVVFFIALLLLGIDSAFSITEAALTSLIDKAKWVRPLVLLVMSCLGMGIGLIYATQSGLNWLGFMDDHIAEGPLGIMLVGLIECLVIGWIFDIKKLRRHANSNSDWEIGVWWEWFIRLVIPIILGGLLLWSLVDYYAMFKAGKYLRDTNGHWVTKDFWGIGMMMAVLVVAILLAMWRRNEKEVSRVS